MDNLIWHNLLLLVQTDSPDVDINSRKRHSVAEILAAAQSDKDTSGLVTISPLVSPLKITYSSPPSGDTGDVQEEVYESDVKFAGITPMHVAASRWSNFFIANNTSVTDAIGNQEGHYFSRSSKTD